VGLLFEHGRFGPSDTARTAAALIPLSAGIAAWSAQAVLSRALYSVGDTWRPMIATSIVTAAIFPLYGWLAGRGIEGLALAGSIGMSLQVLTLAWLARRRLGLDLGALARGLLRALPVAALAAGAAWGIEAWLPPMLTGVQTSLGYGIRLAAAGGAWLAVVLAVGGLIGLPGLAPVIARIRRKLGR